MRSLVAAVAVAFAAHAAHADARGPGVVGGVALGTGTFPLDGEIALGWHLIPAVSLLARAAGRAGERYGAYELGLAARLQPPGALDRLYLEPQLSRLGISLEFDCGLSANDCVGGEASGLAVGVAGGVQLVRGDDVSLDLRIGVTMFDFVDHGSGVRHHDVLAAVYLGVWIF